MVASLEADWQLRLFHRRGTALVLTSDGEAVLEDADRLCRSYDDLFRHVESLRGLSGGSIAIAAPSSIVALRLAKPLGAFVRSHPGVQVNIIESTYGEAQSLMEKDAVDFAFVPHHMQTEGLECTLFERDELVIVAPRSWPWWRRGWGYRCCQASPSREATPAWTCATSRHPRGAACTWYTTTRQT